MNEIIFSVLSTITTVIIVPLITLLGTKLIKWITTKINNENAKNYLEEVNNIIVSTINYVNQTYVETIKRKGNFTIDDQKNAFKKAKEIITSQLTQSTKDYIAKTYGDINQWLEVNIEANLNKIKKAQSKH